VRLGTAAISIFVYSWRGAISSSRAAPISTNSPVRSTATPVGNLRDHAEVVRDEQHAGAVRAHQLADQREDLRLRRDVERGRRLVGDQQRGLEHQRHRDHDPLPLAARQLMRIGGDHARRIGQLDRADDRQHLRAAVRRRKRRVRREHFVDLVAATHHRIQRGHRLLEHHRHPCAAQRLQSRLGGRQQVLAGEQDLAAGRAKIRRKQAHRRMRDDGLARTGFADEAHDFAGIHGEADAGDRVRAIRTGGQRDGEILHGKDGSGHWSATALTTACSSADRAHRAIRHPAC
jgi:hypothetical protein